jgi:hypothetical protein
MDRSCGRAAKGVRPLLDKAQIASSRLGEGAAGARGQISVIFHHLIGGFRVTWSRNTPIPSQ